MFAQGTNKLFHVTYNWKEWQRANDTVKWVSKEGLTHELSTQGSHPFLTDTSLCCPHHKKERKEGELATKSLEFEFHLQSPCGSPLTELSDFCQLAWSGIER